MEVISTILLEYWVSVTKSGGDINNFIGFQLPKVEVISTILLEYWVSVTKSGGGSVVHKKLVEVQLRQGVQCSIYCTRYT